ncbi:hypothetical protein [Hydrocarboniphaga sp.]|uniref:hypothetical protein n=1 Tax=Hydrocarboniphaga sp. TaxID=2033016 RepID=UPI002620E16C|nr:hypothetical protein [Hydrocarboniphaga sp.]
MRIPDFPGSIFNRSLVDNYPDPQEPTAVARYQTVIGNATPPLCVELLAAISLRISELKQLSFESFDGKFRDDHTPGSAPKQ